MFYSRFIGFLWFTTTLVLLESCQNGVLFGPTVSSIKAGDSTSKYIHFKNTGNADFVGFNPNIENNTSDIKCYDFYEHVAPLI